MGMHRSGTSLLAGLLHASGLSMGCRFVEGSGGNPAGLYEAADFVEWHEAVLAAEKGGEWPLCGMRWLRRQPLKESAWEAAMQHATLPGAWTDGPWGWKDPRTLLFLEPWTRRYPALRGLVLFRHPTDVYLSLLRRGDLAVALDPLIAFETYASYHEAALPVLEARPEAFQLIYSDELVTRWEEASGRLEAWLGMPLAHGTVRPQQAHFHPSVSNAASEVFLEQLCPRAVSAYRRLLALGRGQMVSPEPLPGAVSPERADSVLLAYEQALPDGQALATRRRQLRIELGQSLDEIGASGPFFESKIRYYEEQMSRLRESERVLSEQRTHLQKQVDFMRENASVEAWRARRTIMEMRQTLSWRVTRPLRWCRERLGGAAKRQKEARE